ncbi:MAG: SIS domain-containing protein [Bacteroidetes bacterium]|nr:SIS domain-containing protein [Bacteroidota bacterium]
MGIETFIEKYNSEFKNAIEHVEITDHSGNMLNYHVGIELSVNLLLEIQTKNHRMYIVGNGGSAAIASHAAIDFLKNGNIPATTFNDASLLTCMANDYGYENVFVKPIEMLAREGDLVICISSSGNSANIIKAANTAREKNCFVITLSGFEPENTLKALGDINFYVPSFSYGFLEIIHQYILHSILDAKMYCHDAKDVFYKNQNL